jgi:hypothetical protein
MAGSEWDRIVSEIEGKGMTKGRRGPRQGHQGSPLHLRDRLEGASEGEEGQVREGLQDERQEASRSGTDFEKTLDESLSEVRDEYGEGSTRNKIFR